VLDALVAGAERAPQPPIRGGRVGPHRDASQDHRRHAR
jgi:hypothetical protein